MKIIRYPGRIEVVGKSSELCFSWRFLYVTIQHMKHMIHISLKTGEQYYAETLNQKEN